VLDGTFGSPRQRRLTRGLARRRGADFLFVVTECDDATIRRRFEERAKDPTNVSDATWEIYQLLRDSYVPPSDIPPSELLVDPTGGGDTDAVVNRLL
jgi:predicted kinase